MIHNSLNLRSLSVYLLLLTLVAACNEPRRVMLTKNQQKQIEQAISDKAPTPKIVNDVMLDDKLRLVGVDLSTDSVKAGTSFKVTYHWQVLKSLGENDWKIFVHLDAHKRMGFDHQGVGGLYPVKKWAVGKFISYTQTIAVPKDAKSAVAKLYVGVFDLSALKYRNQNVRMKVTNPKKAKVATTPDSRIEAARITIVGASGAPKNAGKKADLTLPQYAVYRTASPLTIDGKLTEPAWIKARATRVFRDPNGYALSARERTRARMVWDDTYIYVGFTVEDRDIFNDFKGRDATLWKKDAVEVYLDRGADGKDYVEIQVSPTGEIFDAHFSSRRKPNNGPRGKRWLPAAERLTIAGMKVKVTAIGSINKRGDSVQDKRYVVEMAIPWKELPMVEGPPKDGEAWGMNLYRINAAGPGSRPFLAAWSPAGGDFHNTNRFATVRFSKKEATAPTNKPGSRTTITRTKGLSRGLRVPNTQGPKKPAPPSVKGLKAPSVKGLKAPTVKRPQVPTIKTLRKPGVTPGKSPVKLKTPKQPSVKAVKPTGSKPSSR